MTRHLTMALLLAAAGWLVAGAAGAATWHVAKDGSGDFTVIQDAVDAAAPGDVIRIHAGRYEEMTEDHDVWGNGYWIADVHVVVRTDDLTLIGDGPDATIVGPANEPEDPLAEHIAIAAWQHVSSLTVWDLMVEHTRDGIVAASDLTSVSGCRVAGVNHGGVVLSEQSGALIDGCEFIDCLAGLDIQQHSWGLARDCLITNPTIGMLVIDDATAEFSGIEIIGGGYSVWCDDRWGDFFTADLTSQLLGHGFGGADRRVDLGPRGRPGAALHGGLHAVRRHRPQRGAVVERGEGPVLGPG